MSDTAPQTAEVGVIGMAVMGSNLARNMARKGFRVAIYNRTASRTDEVIACLLYTSPSPRDRG